MDGIKSGLLYPYLDTADIYHCPGDKRFKKPAVYPGFSGDGGYRSYSIPMGLRGVEWDPAKNAYEAWGVKAHTKITTIKSPGNKYAFVEEADGRGANLGSWAIPIESLDSWTDPIAIWHGDSSTFGFTDGHGERHLWHQPKVIEMARTQTYGITAPGEDTDWIHRGFPHL